MKNLIYILLALPLLFTSCSNDDMTISEETVQVSFCATVPENIVTRTCTVLSVNRVYCAVFENGKEITALREVLEISDDEFIYSPRLIKHRTYDIVFWACNENAYNVIDLTDITRNSGLTEDSYDAFTNSVTITVSNAVSQTIILERPLAQLRMGVTRADWQTVTEIFDMTPTTVVIEFTGKNTYDALRGQTTGNDENIKYILSCPESISFECMEETYKCLAKCFVLPDSGQETMDIKYSLYDETEAIHENIVIPTVQFEKNYQTNIVGSLLTSEITYLISLNNSGLSTDNEHNSTVN